MYFSEADIAELQKACERVGEDYQRLLEGFINKSFSNPRAVEYARHGFSRRLGVLARCIDNIYQIYPPERRSKPAREELIDLTINLQAFIFNLFGCLENLARIWVYEKEVHANGKPLKDTQIGLGSKYSYVHASFSPRIVSYLATESHQQWYGNLENFRHALAHRIPLYIPPYVSNRKEAELERNLERQKMQALMARDFDSYEAIEARIGQLGTFVPWMTHSFSEDANQVVFHAQIIADWNTVIEISEIFMHEL